MEPRGPRVNCEPVRRVGVQGARMRPWAGERMRRRTLWLALAGIAAVPAAALGIALAVVDPNVFAPLLVDAVRHSTGRTLTLGGPITISRSLWPTIVVTGAELSNLPGGSRAYMARADRIEAQLSLPALWGRRLDILQLTLIGPNILFEQVAGKPNWVFDGPAGAPGPPAAPGEPFVLRVRDVRVVDGMVTSRLPARTRVVGLRTLRVSQPQDGAPVSLAGVLVYGDNQPFDIAAGATPQADGEWDATLRLSAFGATVAAFGTATLAGQYNLHVDAQAEALEKLNALWPEMMLPAVHGASLATDLTDGPVAGGLPVVGQTTLRFQSADLTGLKLGATDMVLPAAGGVATVKTSAQWSGRSFALGGTVGVPKNLDGRADIQLDLTAHQAGDASVALKGKLALNTLRFAGLDAAASLQTPSLDAMPNGPALHEVRAQGRVVVPANFTPVTIRGGRLEANEGELTGDVTLGSGKAVTARLASTRLDLDALLPPTDAPTRPSATFISDAPLPWGLLQGPNLDVVANLAGVTWQYRTWPEAGITVRLNGGVLDTGRFTLATPAGPATLSLAVDATRDVAPVSLTLSAPGLPLALVAREAGVAGPVAGTLRLAASLHAAGRSLHELAASLDGSLSASAAGGQLSNQAFVRMTHAALDALSITVPAEGTTTVNCFDLAATFRNGVGQIPLLALQTTYLHVEGAGEVDFGRETMAMKLQPMAQVAGSPVNVPVVLQGPFGHIEHRLDASGLDQIGFLFNGLFGGDKPGQCRAAPPGR